MPVEELVIPAERSATVLVKLDPLTKRGEAIYHMAPLLANLTAEGNFESWATRWRDTYGPGPSTEGLAYVPQALWLYGIQNSNRIYTLRQTFKRITIPPLPTNVVVGGQIIIVRDTLASVFPFFKYIHSAKFSHHLVNWELINAGYHDMLQFLYENIPAVRSRE